MDIKKAAKKSRAAIIEQGAATWDFNHGDYSLSVGHVIDMLDQIIIGKITDHKAHRWLGWAQACMCMGRISSLDTLKQFNKDS